MNIIFLSEARQELSQAKSFYENQRPGLGNTFFKEILEAIDIIALYPEGCQLITKKTRKCLLHKFPYMILYGIINGDIIISAIAHQHRRPQSYLR